MKPPPWHRQPSPTQPHLHPSNEPNPQSIPSHTAKSNHLCTIFIHGDDFIRHVA
ncbi:hypothetical protein BKA80DRAFT_276272, partial [Phyllosticta citrichinensis]